VASLVVENHRGLPLVAQVQRLRFPQGEVRRNWPRSLMQGQLAYAGAPRGEGGQLETEEGLHAHKTVEEHKENLPSFRAFDKYKLRIGVVSTDWRRTPDLLEPCMAVCGRLGETRMSSQKRGVLRIASSASQVLYLLCIALRLQ
jgi:hypothetical protein